VVNDKSEVPDIPYYQGDIEDAVPVKIDYDSLLKLSIGQTIIVEVPQQKFQLEAVIQNIKTKIKGIKTIVAASPDNSANLLVTIGEKSTFANISTPRASYEFVGTTSYGWLMPSANMDQDVDYTKPDYVIEKIREPISYSKDGRSFDGS
jgi:hypothetical protein|tara:strand:+ start:374 stop:820 length:447 start_codon:yes stop_codon:yes gene_type:complete